MCIRDSISGEKNSVLENKKSADSAVSGNSIEEKCEEETEQENAKETEDTIEETESTETAEETAESEQKENTEESKDNNEKQSEEETKITESSKVQETDRSEEIQNDETIIDAKYEKKYAAYTLATLDYRKKGTLAQSDICLLYTSRCV